MAYSQDNLNRRKEIIDGQTSPSYIITGHCLMTLWSRNNPERFPTTPYPIFFCEAVAFALRGMGRDLFPIMFKGAATKNGTING